MTERSKKTKSHKTELQPTRPEKPTKNGHYMGRTCGFEFEDGKYRIAQAIHSRMDDLAAEEQSIRRLMHIENDYFTTRLKTISVGMSEWWERVKEEYGIEGNFSYSGGWLKPIKENEPEKMRCAFCETSYAAGDEAVKHRTECPNDPFAIDFRRRKS